MACSLTAAQAAACASEIGKETDEIRLLQLSAQAALAWAEAVNPGVEYTLAAVMERACESEIGRMNNEIYLLQVWLQNVCNY